MPHPRTLAIVAVGLSATLAACGSGSGTVTETVGTGAAATSPAAVSGVSSSPTVSRVHNSQDANFAADMISHHGQAIDLAGLAAGRASDARVVALARRIQTSQEPEIQMMKRWLIAWGLPGPENMSGMDMGGSMPGMMSTADIAELKATQGTRFDRMFLTMMIAHHQGAITMAGAQVTGGQNMTAKALAEQIITDQTAEITAIRSLLARPARA